MQEANKNYFEFFEIPVSFLLDEAALKQAFYANSRKYHPDFYTQESEEKQEEILGLSTLNNEAYKTLSDADLRIPYVLKLKGALAEEGQNKLPQAFLMEMMEINEALMEFEMDFDPDQLRKVQKNIAGMEKEWFEAIHPILERYDDAAPKQEDLEAIRDYYLKKRYLLRIKENLDKFATL